MNGNGKVSGVKMVRTEMGEPDAKGRRRARIVAGSEHIVPADAGDRGVWFPVHTTWNGWQNTASSWIHKAASSPRKAATTPSRPAPENLCWRRYRPWFRSGRYRHCRRSQSGRRHYELAGSFKSRAASSEKVGAEILLSFWKAPRIIENRQIVLANL